MKNTSYQANRRYKAGHVIADMLGLSRLKRNNSDFVFINNDVLASYEGITENIIRILEERGYMVTFPKEDFITANTLIGEVLHTEEELTRVVNIVTSYGGDPELDDVQLDTVGAIVNIKTVLRCIEDMEGDMQLQFDLPSEADDARLEMAIVKALGEYLTELVAPSNPTAL